MSPSRALSATTVLALTAIATASCGNTSTFTATSNGNALNFTGSGVTLSSTSGAAQRLSMCGEFPVVIGASDSGGRVCVDLDLEPSLIASRTTPATLQIAGRVGRATDGSGVAVAFGAGPGNDPAVSSAFTRYDCFCPNPTMAVVTGTLTLYTIEAHRLTGTLVFDSNESQTGATSSSTLHVEATFDAVLDR